MGVSNAMCDDAKVKGSGGATRAAILNFHWALFICKFIFKLPKLQFNPPIVPKPPERAHIILIPEQL
jgi:hypothetical protein